MLSSSGWGRAPRLRESPNCGTRDRPSFPSLAENEVSGWEGGVRLEEQGESSVCGAARISSSSSSTPERPFSAATLSLRR